MRHGLDVHLTSTPHGLMKISLIVAAVMEIPTTRSILEFTCMSYTVSLWHSRENNQEEVNDMIWKVGG